MSRSYFAVGIDPGAVMGVAAIGMTNSTIRVLETASLTTVHDLHRWLSNYGVPDVTAVEWWAYQGPNRARGVPHAAEACGRVGAALDLFARPYTPYTRAEVLKSLNLKANANKNAVLARIRVLAQTDPKRPMKNDHEADATATAIAGLNRIAWEQF